MSEPKTLQDRLFACLDEVLKAKLAESDKRIDDKIDGLLASKEAEIGLALHKGYGLEHDPVIHQSDLISYGRKAALEKADTAKRTPASETPSGPDGNTPQSPIDAMFAKAKKGEPIEPQ